jgi:hypothetical protein
VLAAFSEGAAADGGAGRPSPDEASDERLRSATVDDIFALIDQELDGA